MRANFRREGMFSWPAQGLEFFGNMELRNGRTRGLVNRLDGEHVLKAFFAG